MTVDQIAAVLIAVSFLAWVLTRATSQEVRDWASMADHRRARRALARATLPAPPLAKDDAMKTHDAR